MNVFVESKKCVEWTEEVFVRKAKERNLVGMEKIFHIREHAVPNMANFGIKKGDIGGKKSHFWDDSYYISG